MKSLLLILSLLLATNAWAEGLTLECKGSASLDSIEFGKNIFSSILLFYMDEENNSGWVKVPLNLQPGTKGWKKEEPYKLTDLSVTDSMIKASFKRNLINKSEITIDRMTGLMEYSGFGVRFNGECSPFVAKGRKF